MSSQSSEPGELTATVSSKGQIVIPSRIRQHLGLAQGSLLRFVLDGETVRLLPPAGDVQRLKGRLAAPAAKVSVEDMNSAITERRSKLSQR